MRTYNISSRYANQCMKIIMDHCNEDDNDTFSGQALSDFCSNPKNLIAIRMLSAEGWIRFPHVDASKVPTSIWLENEGILYFQIKYEKRTSAIKGFALGCFTGVLSTIVFPLIYTWLATILF